MQSATMYVEVEIMASVELTTKQVIDLVRQLPPDRKREVLFVLASESQSRSEARIAHAEDRLRRLCSERGLNWDAMTDEQREALVDDLIHEDRSCAE